MSQTGRSMVQEMHVPMVSMMERGILKHKWQVPEEVWAGTGYQGHPAELIDDSRMKIFHRQSNHRLESEIRPHSGMEQADT